MTTPFISPGTSQNPTRIVTDFSQIPRFSRKDLSTGAASMFRPNTKGGIETRIVIKGLTVARTHAAAVLALIPGALGIIHTVTGEFTREEARAALRGERTMTKAFLSGDTHNSTHYRLETRPNMVKTTIGPTTFYAPLIEFGLARHMRFGPRPFMSMAFAEVLPHHLRALIELAEIASGPRQRLTGKEHGPPTNSFLRRFRAFLYTTEKAIGDTVIYTGGPLVSGQSKLREGMIGIARVLGDIQSVMGRAVGARVTRRLEGKVSGRLIGIGSHTVFASRSYTLQITGAQRIYNKEAGKYMSRFLGQTNLFGGRFGG